MRLWPTDVEPGKAAEARARRVERAVAELRG